jgi:hypothetical protein
MTTTSQRLSLDTVLQRVEDVCALADGKGYVACCPAHKSLGRRALSIIPLRDTVWLHCHAGCKHADITREILLSPVLRTVVPPLMKPRTIALPALLNRAIVCHNRLLDSPPLLNFLWTRRGISEVVADRFWIGATDVQLTGSKVTSLIWTLPIRKDNGFVGIKFHRDPKPENRAKLFWQPVGIDGSTLTFPSLEELNLKPGDRIVVAPGELKAAAFLSVGIAAISRVAGEGAGWPSKLAERFKGLRVVLDPDREDSKVAKEWVTKTVKALLPYALTVEVPR